MNDFENRLNKLVEGFVRESFNTNLVKYDYNLLTFENNQIFVINEDKLMENINLAIIYSELVNEYMIYYNIDFCISFSDIISCFYNSSLSFRKNQDVYFVNSKNIIKKSINGINRLLSKFGLNENEGKSYSVILPLVFKGNNTKYNKILELINLISKIVTLDRVFIFSLYDINIEDKVDIQQKINKFKETNIDINLIDKSLITKRNIFENLLNVGVIDKDHFDKINMFINPEQDEVLTNNIRKPKVIQNSLFVRFKEISYSKKSNVCLSLESITDSTEIIKYTNLLGNYVVAIKINSNFIYNESILKGLKKLSEHHNFIIIDDKKLVLNDMSDLKKINLYQYVDVISVTLNFISEDIDKWFSVIRKQINKNASITFNIQPNELENRFNIVSNQYTYFNNIVFGIIGIDKTDNDMFSILNYKHVSHLNDKFTSLKNTDIVVLEDELYKSKNPIEIVNKINNIINQ